LGVLTAGGKGRYSVSYWESSLQGGKEGILSAIGNPHCRGERKVFCQLLRILTAVERKVFCHLLRILTAGERKVFCQLLGVLTAGGKGRYSVCYWESSLQGGKEGVLSAIGSPHNEGERKVFCQLLGVLTAGGKEVILSATESGLAAGGKEGILSAIESGLTAGGKEGILSTIESGLTAGGKEGILSDIERIHCREGGESYSVTY
jgi:hypothetical protein